MKTSTPVDEMAKLRRFAQQLATYHQEPCLIILDPPPSPVQQSQSSIPYVVLQSQAQAEERQAAVETIYPQ